MARGSSSPVRDNVSVAIKDPDVLLRSERVFRQMTSYDTGATTGSAEDQFGEDNGGVERSMVN